MITSLTDYSDLDIPASKRKSDILPRLTLFYAVISTSRRHIKHRIRRSNDGGRKIIKSNSSTSIENDYQWDGEKKAKVVNEEREPDDTTDKAIAGFLPFKRERGLCAAKQKPFLKRRKKCRRFSSPLFMKVETKTGDERDIGSNKFSELCYISPPDWH